MKQSALLEKRRNIFSVKLCHSCEKHCCLSNQMKFLPVHWI